MDGFLARFVPGPWERPPVFVKALVAVTAVFAALVGYGLAAISHGYVVAGMGGLLVAGFVVAIRTDDVQHPMLDQLTDAGS